MPISGLNGVIISVFYLLSISSTLASAGSLRYMIHISWIKLLYVI